MMKLDQQHDMMKDMCKLQAAEAAVIRRIATPSVGGSGIPYTGQQQQVAWGLPPAACQVGYALMQAFVDARFRWCQR
jgi:hypothetical protein